MIRYNLKDFKKNGVTREDADFVLSGEFSAYQEHGYSDRGNLRTIHVGLNEDGTRLLEFCVEYFEDGTEYVYEGSENFTVKSGDEWVYHGMEAAPRSIKLFQSHFKKT